MITENDDSIVFFEGNLATARAPRIMFLNHHNTKDFLTDYFWHFHKRRAAQSV